MGAYQRTKGHDFERAVSEKMRQAGYPEAGRILEYQLENCQGVDIKGTAPYKIQCKCMAKVPNIPQVFKEFTGLNEHDIPVIMFKVTNKGEFAAMRLDDLLALIKRSGYDTSEIAV